MKILWSFPPLLLFLTIAHNAAASSSSDQQAEVVVEVVQEAFHNVLLHQRTPQKPDFFHNAPQTVSNIDHGKELMQWIQSSNGKAYIHESLEIRKRHPNDTDSREYGIFAKNTIAANKILLEIPQEMMVLPTSLKIDDRVEVHWVDQETYGGHITQIHEDGTFDVQFDNEMAHNVKRERIDHESFPVNCGTLQRLVYEMGLGDDSQFAPYTNYLRDQPRGQLPADWSQAGQELLGNMIGKKKNGDSILPPDGAFDWLEEDLRDRCSKPLDFVTTHAYMLYIQRSADEVFVPIFDMIRHSNGKELNTRNGPVRQGQSVKARSSRVIQAGEELHTSFNFCADCEDRLNDFGTPELLREYGFVEDYPQKWVFQEQQVSFNLARAVGEDGNETDELKLTWNDGDEPVLEDVIFFRQQLQRLKDLAETELVFPNPSIPQQEWEIILKYYDALTNALTLAIKASGMDIDKDSCLDLSSDSCDVDFAYRYEHIQTEAETWGDERPATCDCKREFVFNSWETIDIVESRYQGVTFSINPQFDDMCFDLDNTVQICSSYRPQYHEMMVHFSARYLEEVKRVLFVGGGDSMLLHEIIKYPSLEKVVGLELDQRVTRSSYQYFGTQPHWDNEKVEWWFGDATKSLLMLPKEYFGSFDLVLVDLSETVMALSVTDELDVMEALALLIKPNGILVKNEYMYMLSQAEIFKHTLHVHWYHVPVVCSQSLILASNGVDFMRGPYVEHEVEHLYELLDDPTLRDAIVRDYQKNETATQNQCKGRKSVQDEQVRSPGILMLVDAEDTTADLENMELFEAEIIGALVKSGLSVVSTLQSEDETDAILTVLLREGYVVARTWFDQKTCALDIHLWSAFDKHESAKKALVAALGSTTVSSYRIVAGGMFGVDTWTEDMAKNGPKVEELCSPPINIVRSSHDLAIESSVIETAVKEMLTLVNETSYKAAVLCPNTDCESAKTLEQMKNVELLVIKACDDISDGVEFAKDASDRMFACEKEIRKILNQASNSKIRALVVDRHAPYALGQIALKLLRSSANDKRWLAQDIMVVAPILHEKETWKKVFVETFRREVYLVEPVFSANVLFNSSKSSFELAVTASGDSLFSKSIDTVAHQVEFKTGMDSEVINIRGGVFIFQDNLVPDRIFFHKDYDQNGPYEQWISQEPLGFQTVFQLELKPYAKGKLSASRVSELTKLALETVDLSEDHYQFKQWDLSDSSQNSLSGDGSVVMAVWPEGNVVVVWDGKVRVDVNLFTYEEDFDHADSFIEKFSGMKSVLRDEQPRGRGRVVNFQSDLTPKEDPHWYTKST